MTFEEFKSNVEAWAEARGIYEHSTPLAQALKAVSEVGELADAVIKGDREALKDAIGDVAVCLVNVARMSNNEILIGEPHLRGRVDIKKSAAALSYSVGGLACNWYADCVEFVGDSIDESFDDLVTLCLDANIQFCDCLASAWNEIKDRKGRMVPGGAFVKECDA